MVAWAACRKGLIVLCGFSCFKEDTHNVEEASIKLSPPRLSLPDAGIVDRHAPLSTLGIAFLKHWMTGLLAKLRGSSQRLMLEP